ncbi:hypothetical protein MHYP_G00147280 [Metynnis hypsauchen]
MAGIYRDHRSKQLPPEHIHSDRKCNDCCLGRARHPGSGRAGQWVLQVHCREMNSLAMEGLNRGSPLRSGGGGEVGLRIVLTPAVQGHLGTGGRVPERVAGPDGTKRVKGMMTDRGSGALVSQS